MKIIVGLGNPGDKYIKSRHNIGFIFLDYLRFKFESEDFKEKSKFKSFVSEVNIGDEKYILVKPTTFMNNSGEAIVALENFYKVGYDNFLICYDDIDLPFGELRHRDTGSAGTHNGMRSVIELTGTQDLPRLRFGIDVEDRRGELRNFVLNDFSKNEEAKIGEWMTGAYDLLKEKGFFG